MNIYVRKCQIYIFCYFNSKYVELRSIRPVVYHFFPSDFYLSCGYLFVNDCWWKPPSFMRFILKVLLRWTVDCVRHQSKKEKGFNGLLRFHTHLMTATNTKEESNQRIFQSKWYALPQNPERTKELCACVIRPPVIVCRVCRNLMVKF